MQNDPWINKPLISFRPSKALTLPPSVPGGRSEITFEINNKPVMRDAEGNPIYPDPAPASVNLKIGGISITGPNSDEFFVIYDNISGQTVVPEWMLHSPVPARLFASITFIPKYPPGEKHAVLKIPSNAANALKDPRFTAEIPLTGFCQETGVRKLYAARIEPELLENRPCPIWSFSRDEHFAENDPRGMCSDDAYPTGMPIIPGDAYRSLGTCPDGQTPANLLEYGSWNIWDDSEEPEPPSPVTRAGHGDGGSLPASLVRQETPPPPRVWALIIIGDEGERMFRVTRKMIREICTKFGFIVTAGSLLRNRKTHPLTRAMIDNAVRDLWQQSGDPRDFLLVWYAGHGSGSWSFALWDNLEITPYPLFNLLAADTHFHQITVISDCCASGSITDDLRRWIASPEGQASMRGRRILTHYHASEGYTESAGFFTTINYGGGLAYTLHLHRGLCDKAVTVDPANPTASWTRFHAIMSDRSAGWTLLSARNLVCAAVGYWSIKQVPGFTTVTGPP